MDQFENSSTVGLPGNVTIALTSGTPTLSGTTTVNFAGNGTATYTNLQISTAGAKQLTASASGLTAAVSNTFTVIAARAATDNFRSRTSANWATASTWERSPAMVLIGHLLQQHQMLHPQIQLRYEMGIL